MFRVCHGVDNVGSPMFRAGRHFQIWWRFEGHQACGRRAFSYRTELKGHFYQREEKVALQRSPNTDCSVSTVFTLSFGRPTNGSISHLQAPCIRALGQLALHANAAAHPHGILKLNSMELADDGSHHTIAVRLLAPLVRSSTHSHDLSLL